MTSNTKGGTTTFEGVAEQQHSHDPDSLRDMFELMMLGRAVDERMWLLNRAGQAPFAVSGQGHEAAQAGMVQALDLSKDWIVPYYRDITMSLGFGLTATDLILAMLAKSTDPASGGRQMPNHFGSSKLRILSGSSPIATQIPHATGIAFAAKARAEDTVVVTSFGDGATSEGDFHEAVNFATVYDLGVIFLCQNNEYAISVPLDLQMGVDRVADRAKGYGIPGIRVNGLDAVEVYEAATIAVERARRGEGPSLIETMVRRFHPHSSDDDDRTYRSEEELEHMREDGPIRTTGRRLRDMGVIDDAWEEDAKERIKQVVNDATDSAEDAPMPDPATLAKYVFFEKD